MAELSPAAKAVDDATAEVEARIEFTDLAAGFNAYRNAVAVAALRAAADQVVPDLPKPSADSDYHLMNWSKSLDQYYQRQQTRAELLAIATELENHQ